MFEFNFCFASPVWTDVVQALAAAVAIPGAIAAFVVLFKKNEQLQDAISEFKRLAVATEAKGVIEAEKRDLLAEHLELLRSMVHSGPIGVGGDKLAELEERKYLLSMRPRLICNGVKYSGSEVTPWIENHGEAAFLLGVEDLTDTPILINRTAGLKNRWEVKSAGYFQISCVRRDGLNWNAPAGDVKFRISYEDKEGNVYEQYLEGPVGKPLTMTEPKLIERKKYDNN